MFTYILSSLVFLAVVLVLRLFGVIPRVEPWRPRWYQRLRLWMRLRRLKRVENQPAWKRRQPRPRWAVWSMVALVALLGVRILGLRWHPSPDMAQDEQPEQPIAQAHNQQPQKLRLVVGRSGYGFASGSFYYATVRNAPDPDNPDAPNVDRILKCKYCSGVKEGINEFDVLPVGDKRDYPNALMNVRCQYEAFFGDLDFGHVDEVWGLYAVDSPEVAGFFRKSLDPSLAEEAEDYGGFGIGRMLEITETKETATTYISTARAIAYTGEVLQFQLECEKNREDCASIDPKGRTELFLLLQRTDPHAYAKIGTSLGNISLISDNNLSRSSLAPNHEIYALVDSQGVSTKWLTEWVQEGIDHERGRQ
jgi:hypothetical protein